MRILHVIQELGVGGAERITVALVHGARDAGHDVAVAAAPGALAVEAGVDVHPLPIIGRRMRAFPRAIAALAAALAAERPDVLHVHNPGMAALAAVTTRLRRRTPGLVSVHGIPAEDDRAAGRVLRLANLPVVACGGSVASALRAHDVRVLETIENGIPPPPARADREELRREWGLEPNRPIVMSIGRLVPQKNHALALRALPQVRDAALVVVGDGPEASQLRGAAVAAGVADRVVFAGARRDAWALMGAADVVVLPSRGEGLPLTLLEALAIGTPVVATRVRGIDDVVDHERTALLVPADDATALAGAVNRVLADAGLRASLAASGREASARFDDSAMVKRYLDVYERVAARRV